MIRSMFVTADNRVMKVPYDQAEQQLDLILTGFDPGAFLQTAFQCIEDD